MKKDAKKQQNHVSGKRKKKALKAVAALAAITAVCVAAALILPGLASASAAERITTYSVEQITYGNVSTTISGSGTLTPVTHETVVAETSGEASSVSFTVGDEVKEGDVLAVISSDGGEEKIVSPCDGILTEFPLSDGDEVAAGGSVAMVMGKDGFTMGVAVDELNISLVKIGQEVDFTVDAVDGELSGTVTSVSYNGSTSGQTTAYQITATADYAEGIYPGMSATAEIVVEDSGEGLLVPVEAVSVSGDDSYVYLAPENAELGASYGEEELDLSELERVTVSTGMSDGSYILIESEELSESDLIVVTRVTSSQTSSKNEDENSFDAGGFGGFSAGGMDFGDFDFENFDPSQMPQGGGSFPGFGN